MTINALTGQGILIFLHCFKGIFRKAHLHDLTGMHDLTGNLAYYDFFRKTHAPLYFLEIILDFAEKVVRIVKNI